MIKDGGKNMNIWEWFLPASERHKYYSQIMEGPHGGSGGPLWTPWDSLSTTDKWKRVGGWLLVIVIIFAVAAFLDWFSPSK